MEKLYFFVTSCTTWQNDSADFLRTYFVDQGAFGHCFLIALCVAAVGAALFYGLFGMKIASLSNIPVWVVTLVVVALVTLGITQLSVIGSKDSDNGVFLSMHNKLTTDLQDVNKTERQKEEINIAYDELSNKLDEKCDVVYALDAGNVVYAVLLFFIISIVVKRFTVHATGVPFVKP